MLIFSGLKKRDHPMEGTLPESVLYSDCCCIFQMLYNTALIIKPVQHVAMASHAIVHAAFQPFRSYPPDTGRVYPPWDGPFFSVH